MIKSIAVFCKTRFQDCYSDFGTKFMNDVKPVYAAESMGGIKIRKTKMQTYRQ